MANPKLGRKLVFTVCEIDPGLIELTDKRTLLKKLVVNSLCVPIEEKKVKTMHIFQHVNQWH